MRSTFFFFLEIEINVFYDFVNCVQLMEETSLASFSWESWIIRK